MNHDYDVIYYYIVIILMTVNWNQFGNVLQDTGYPKEVLDYVWKKYATQGYITSAEDMYK